MEKYFQLRFPIDATQITQIEAGLRLLENSTKIGDRYCVRFVPRTNEANWVRIYNGGGCSSYVGKNIGPGEQLLSLKKPTIESPGTCLTPGIIAHEFIHALGNYLGYKHISTICLTLLLF
jgi:hypothetical protein